MSVCFLNIMNSNLPGFGFKVFTLNNYRICPKPNSRLSNISPNIFSQELSVLASAKLHMPDSETEKNITFMKMLSNKGLRINPWVSHKLLPTSL